MKMKIILVSITLISFLTNCQKESINPSIEGTYLVNESKALERYEDSRLCVQCGPLELFPSKISLVKVSEKYNLTILGEHFKENSTVKEPYSNIFINVILGEDGVGSTISFKGAIIGKVDSRNLKISNLIFEVSDKPNPMIDTKYISISAKK